MKHTIDPHMIRHLSLEETCRKVAELGYDHIELSPRPDFLSWWTRPKVDPERIAISLNEMPVLLPNYEIVLDEEKAKAVLAAETIVITIDLHQGAHEAKFWTCDLTKEYVHINASYRS